MLNILLNTRRSVVDMENGALKYGSNNNNNDIVEEKVVSTSLATVSTRSTSSDKDKWSSHQTRKKQNIVYVTDIICMSIVACLE